MCMCEGVTRVRDRPSKVREWESGHKRMELGACVSGRDGPTDSSRRLLHFGLHPKVRRSGS